MTVGRRTGEARLAEIRTYPVKSVGGIALGQADVEPWGLRHDRRWLLLNPDGTVLTARQHHEMLALTATADDDALTISGRDGSLCVDNPVDGELLPTTLSRLESVRAAGRDADRWLSIQLGRPVRLGWLDDPRRRSVSEAHGGKPGDKLSLADAGPLLLTTDASLRQLNRWLTEDAAQRGNGLPTPIVMTRFRPNVVIETSDEAFAEDEWAMLRIGNVTFRLGERCDRCVLTTIDPETRIAGKEPLRTLARHRRRAGKVWFGIRIIPLTQGRIHVGDPVAVGASEVGQRFPSAEALTPPGVALVGLDVAVE